ncbi:hypothetical protein JCM30471_04690 [Desulfuromonas carbonis]|uniref:NAD(P)/FAD-dependent oxidoreductase n=1 Tax=Desulfuromonas sp. DDH964 TaxID=1823759 RepID=UPI00078C821A|nr:FAD-dependent monooxygenase [Desulfuromonas sp. DDH964]AMV71971.1 FAD-dependent oxidoreductase [Desulfuromonas sp. DDH964]
MRLRLRELSLRLDEAEEDLPGKVAAILGVEASRISALQVVRRAIDARKKPRVVRVYTVEFSVPRSGPLEAAVAADARLEEVVATPLPVLVRVQGEPRVLVVGMGPAGLFAARRLATAGCRVTLAERGRPVEQRVRDVDRFWRDGLLNEESNVQFGEGGAGAFSDGKLTTRINHPWTRLVLETLVECGAPAEILSAAKPHVGTDRLRLVLINFRRALEAAGVVLRFESCLTGLMTADGRVVGGRFQDGREVACDHLVLAPGHSARDTYRMLEKAGVALQLKPFAVGLRVEHPVAVINRIQYGMAAHPRLPAADYALAWNDPDSRRGVYSFCMCPGGEVVIASSAVGGVAVNGMSYLQRGGEWSNSALVVSVGPADFEGADPLAGVRFQERWEAAAFVAGGGNYRAPAQNLLAFLGRGSGPVRSTCRPGVRAAELDQVLPDAVSQGLRRALPHFDRRMQGFITAEATLTGVETRTSAPLRILRGATGESVSHGGLYPAGEGAGYAGGIMSAALDGLRVAETIIQRVTDRSPE